MNSHKNGLNLVLGIPNHTPSSLNATESLVEARKGIICLLLLQYFSLDVFASSLDSYLENLDLNQKSVYQKNSMYTKETTAFTTSIQSLKKKKFTNHVETIYFNTSSSINSSKEFIMLINSKSIEVFHNKTRGQINHIVSGHCKTEACAEHKQAEALRDLREVWIPNKFKLQDIAKIK